MAAMSRSLAAHRFTKVVVSSAKDVLDSVMQVSPGIMTPAHPLTDTAITANTAIIVRFMLFPLDGVGLGFGPVY